MYSHVRVKHSDLKIKCTECKFSHTFPTKVKAHYKQVHLGVKRPHRRYICRKKTCQKFDTTICTNLEFHSLLFCDKCDFTSGRGDDFKFHTESVHDGIVYKCEYCTSYTVKRKGTLNEHILHKHSIRNGKEFKKLFTCTDEDCKFETQYGNSLKKHIEAKHEGIVRYKCDFMNCDYRTNESKSLREHSFFHNGGTPHKCDRCDKMFTRLRQMTKHKKKQHIGTDDAKLLKPQKTPFQKIKSIIASIKPEISLIKDENNLEFDDVHHIHETTNAKNLEKEQQFPEPEDKSVTLEKEQKSSESEGKAVVFEKELDKTSYSCLCAAPGCDFISDETLQEQEMREHFDSAHKELPFANDSFIWLNPDMAMLLETDF